MAFTLHDLNIVHNRSQPWHCVLCDAQPDRPSTPSDTLSARLMIREGQTTRTLKYLFTCSLLKQKGPTRYGFLKAMQYYKPVNQILTHLILLKHKYEDKTVIFSETMIVLP